ncbi:MAG: EamA/RhaT family transporter, partial [Sphaerospermopsis sp. SIO1G2]|nr:EamA/RhaT family transporter [Sphaerospermopsis sp. SIO1G2]
MTQQTDNMQGILWIIAGMFIFSLQNIAIKWISGGYPIFQIVIIRCLMALPLTVILFRLEGGRGWR